MEDRNGNHLDFDFDANGIESITDTRGRTLEFTLNADTDITEVEDWTGRSWQYGYDSARRLTSVTDPEGEVTGYGYDGTGLLEEITDARGNVIEIGYDGHERVTSVTRVVNGSTADVTTSYAYSSPSSPCVSGDEAVGKTVVTDPRGKVTTYCWNARGKVTRARNALNQDTTTTYTPNSDVSNFTGFAGTGSGNEASTSMSYDSSGSDPTNNLTGGTMPMGETFAQGSGRRRATPATRCGASGSSSTPTSKAPRRCMEFPRFGGQGVIRRRQLLVS